jgi:hypothetical protein
VALFYRSGPVRGRGGGKGCGNMDWWEKQWGRGGDAARRYGSDVIGVYADRVFIGK